MPKVFKVEKAFLSTGDDKTTPQVINTQGGEMHKYMVQFADQEVPGWIGILKKPGNEVKVGDEMYGVLEKNQWGKPQFTRMQLPQDGSVKLNMGSSTTQAPKTQSTPQLGGSLEQKVDKILEVVQRLEATFLQPSAGAPAQRGQDVVLDDIEDKPVDLSEIPY